MIPIYRKRGRAAIREGGQTVVVSEAGEAFERDRRFSVRPLRENVDVAAAAASEVEAVAREIEGLVPTSLKIERLLVSHGVADHEMAGVEWSDESRRIHLAIESPTGLRTLVDQGDFDCAEIAHIAKALARVAGERQQPASLRLAPIVSAAILPMLVGAPPDDIELWQRSGGIDGMGAPIIECRVQALPWPNWYRPSYRTRPVNTPMNLEVRASKSAIDDGLPCAVALLAPVTGRTLRVLIEDGRRVNAATIRISRVIAAGIADRWYPYGAGAYGSSLILSRE